jgi:SNF2 family DNA or RNA helicase
MLFYSQIKQLFSTSTWKQGQILFRNGAVQDVKLVNGRAQGKITILPENEQLISFQIVRGTIREARCTCKYDTDSSPCSHIAALGIWLVERGSLLRAGLLGDEEDEPSAPSSPNDTPEKQDKPVPGEMILSTRGLFRSHAFTTLVIESAVRYIDPHTKTAETKSLLFLSRQNDTRLWKTTQGVLIQVTRPLFILEDDPEFLQKLEANKLIYQGPKALDMLVRLLTHPQRKQIYFDEAIDVKLDPDPLKLVSLRIGGKSEDGRSLSYEYGNAKIQLTSEELESLSQQGRLSNRFVWKGDRIYRLDTELEQIHRYANRSGLAPEAEYDAEEGLRPSGFGKVHDDSDHPLHPLAAYRLSLELGVNNFQVDPEWKEFHDWKTTFDRETLPTLSPVDYGFKLRTYQKNGLHWLWSLYHRGLAALLADEMGLGKTHQVLAFLSTLYLVSQKKRRTGNEPRPGYPSLVIAPTSVIAAWTQKLKKYDTGLKWHVFHGSARKLPSSGIDLVLTTYGILHREPILRERQWHVIILDEAQAIKNAGTIASQACRKMKSNFRIAMTGTPVENQATDLWSLMEFLLPGYLGSLARFKRLYGWGRDQPSALQSQALRRLTSPFLLRRTKNKVLQELPEKTEEIIPCEMTSTQRRRYLECLNSAEAERARANLRDKAKKIDFANILALLTRLKQVCDHPKLPEMTSGRLKRLSSVDPFQSAKWEALDELIQEALGSNLKIVVFTQYLKVIDLLGHFLKKQHVGFVELRGDTPDRAARLDRFASDPECKVFICSLLAGGLGIDLTSASVCIHFDRWWNPARENQATDRLHRIGQTRGVQVFKLLIPDSVEDRIAQIIESKTLLSGSLIGESSTGLKAFSRDELLGILTPTSLHKN